MHDKNHISKQCWNVVAIGFLHSFNPQKKDRRITFAQQTMHRILASTYWALLLVGTIMSLQTQAQEVRFITTPAANRVGIQDLFEVQYSIQNAGMVMNFTIPDLTDFQVMGNPSRSTRVNISNGQRSYAVDFVYVFKPKKKGRCVIPGALATIENNRQIKSNTVFIDVVDGKLARPQQPTQSIDPFAGFFEPDEDPFGDPLEEMQRQQRELQKQIQRMQQQMRQAFGDITDEPDNMPNRIDKEHLNDNLFIKVDVDKTKVNLGEQVTASYKLYTRLPIHMNITKLPALSGFWSQDFDLPEPPQPRGEVLNGKVYTVYELKRTALFPTQTGNLVLDPAVAESVERVNNGQPVVIRSNPIQIEVAELPNALKPDNFDGAVGSYSLESNIDKTELTTDDVVTITVRISGTGNLKLVNAPRMKFPESADVYDTKVFDTITNTNNVIAGYKTFSFTFQPRNTGSFVIPAAEFVYFDTKENMYKKLSGQQYTIHVTPGNNHETETVQTKLKEIHDIDGSKLTLRKSKNKSWITHPLYWSGFGVPALAYVFLAFYRRRQDKINSNTVLLKNKKANKIALQRLETAERFMKEASESKFYEETSKAVWLYLSDKMNIPLSELSKEVASTKLLEKNIPETLQEEVFRITDECEMALYASGSGSMHRQQIYNDAFKLIGKLEEYLS